MRTFQLFGTLGILFAAALGLAAPVATKEGPCATTFRVENCSGEVIPEIRIEIESTDGSLVAVTDEEGRATLAACAAEIDEVQVYLFEGGDPVSVNPSFEDEAETGAAARLVVC
ncbi:MAG: hypothetical protein VYE73_11770 [Acidobacteriota bacterium]|nr:hypothetical protein [Acidobacteriota bacterium]